MFMCLRPLRVKIRSTVPSRCLYIKRVELYQKCCRILGVEESADQNTVRRAYIELVKKVHPDSGQEEASAERFHEIDEAFKVLQEKFAKNRRGIYEDDEEEVQDIRHTAPQHRQYLSYEGMGVGNPFQRQKQYQQIKAMKAQERILKHRIERSQTGDGRTLMKKEAFYKEHPIKTQYGFDRLVEDYIQEAMSKGDFDNLRGAGKPLTTAQTQNPYLDFTTHKLNKILLDNGFTPEWIRLQREIHQALKDLKTKLRTERSYFGEYPLSDADASEWQQILEKYEDAAKQINTQIDKYNLIVPICDKQFFRVRLAKLAQEILQDPTSLRGQVRPKIIAGDAVGASAAAPKFDLLTFLSSFF